MYGNKGQGLSINVIVITALAVLVLVVVSVIFLNGANPETDQCSSYPDATCASECREGEVEQPSLSCEDPDDVCCAPLG